MKQVTKPMLVMTIRNSFDPCSQSTTVRMTVAPSTQDFLHAVTQHQLWSALYPLLFRSQKWRQTPEYHGTQDRRQLVWWQ